MTKSRLVRRGTADDCSDNINVLYFFFGYGVRVIRQDDEHHTLVEGIDGQWRHWTTLYNPSTGYGEIWHDYTFLESIQRSLGSFDWYFKNGAYNNGLPDGHCSTAHFANFRHFYNKSSQVRLAQSLRSDTNEIRGFANAVYQSLLF